MGDRRASSFSSYHGMMSPSGLGLCKEMCLPPTGTFPECHSCSHSPLTTTSHEGPPKAFCYGWAWNPSMRVNTQEHYRSSFDWAESCLSPFSKTVSRSAKQKGGGNLFSPILNSESTGVCWALLCHPHPHPTTPPLPAYHQHETLSMKTSVGQRPPLLPSIRHSQEGGKLEPEMA